METMETSTQPNTQTESSAGFADDARETLRMAKGAAERELGARKTSLAHQLESVARALRTTAETLKEQEQSTAANYARQAAQAVEGAGRKLEEKSIADLLSEVQRLSRDKPAWVVGAAAVVGFIGSRVLRNLGRSDAPQSQQPQAQSQAMSDLQAQPSASVPASDGEQLGGI